MAALAVESRAVLQARGRVCNKTEDAVVVRLQSVFNLADREPFLRDIYGLRGCGVAWRVFSAGARPQHPGHMPLVGAAACSLCVSPRSLALCSRICDTAC